MKQSMYTSSSNNRQSEDRRNMEQLSLREMNRIVSVDHDRRVQDYTAEEQDFIRMMMQSVTEQYQNKKASGDEDIYAQWDLARGAPLPYKPREYASLQPMEGQGAQSFMPFARQGDMLGREPRPDQASGSGGSWGIAGMPVGTPFFTKPVVIERRLEHDAGASVREARSADVDPPSKTDASVLPGKSDTILCDEFRGKIMKQVQGLGDIIMPVFERNLALKKEQAVLKEQKAALEEKMAGLLKTNQDLQEFVGLLGRQYGHYQAAREAGTSDDDKARANQAALLILKTIAARTTSTGHVDEV